MLLKVKNLMIKQRWSRMKGIDISSHNAITNYNLLKGQIDFAIVRASWGFFQEDVKLKEHIKGLDSVGIPYGLYHYSYARNLDEAKKEVEGFINIAKGLNPDSLSRFLLIPSI